MKCELCKKILHGRQTRFCSKECKTKFYSKYENRSEKSKESSKRASKRWRKNLNKEVDRLLGDSCRICKRDIKLASHKKDGKEHDTSGGTNSLQGVIKNPKDFVRLCYPCHKAVHWIMYYFNMTWEDIVETLKYNERLYNLAL